uniref:Uncharacterized protein n=1 Tax=Octopus bimaculoides TaxID=37653 RepID=A0A0L8H629_OCTBM
MWLTCLRRLYLYTYKYKLLIHRKSNSTKSNSQVSPCWHPAVLSVCWISAKLQQ